MFTFYLIFSVVNNRLINNQGSKSGHTFNSSENSLTEDVWLQPNLVSKPWQLNRIELYTTQQKYVLDRLIESEVQDLILLNSWQMLSASATDTNDNIPKEGILALAFIQQDSQPLVFRIHVSEKELLFYRMIDNKQFSYPRESMINFLPEKLIASLNHEQTK